VNPSNTQVAIAAIALLAVLCSPFVVPVVGDVAIVVAGADRRVLRQYPVDRAYFVGLGLSLVLAATISTTALVIASAVAFGVHGVTAPLVILAAVYFLLILSLDRWLVSDPTAGFPDQAAGGSGLAWVRHAVIELVKVAPRMIIAFVASTLFANFILLVVFAPEIRAEINVMQVRQDQQFTKQVEAEVAQRTNDAHASLAAAAQEKKAVQDAFDAGTAAIQQAAQARDAALKDAASRGVHCTQQAITQRVTDPKTGLYRIVVTGYRDVCPQEIQDINNTYDQVAQRFPQTQAEVNQQMAAIDSKYGVAALQAYVSAGAEKQVQQDWSGQRPALGDGLLVRMAALDELTTPPRGTCSPSDPSAPACTSRYSARAASLQDDLRYWILALEMAPIVVKLVMSILPRRGYASLMAARDEEAKNRARIRMDGLAIEHRLAIEQKLREERVAVDELVLLEEVQKREVTRLRRQWGLQRMRSQLARADVAGSVRSFFGRVWSSYPGTPPEAPEAGPTPIPEAVAPGMRVVDNEDFL
jgi:Domain of unknown function (DUF4407)